MIYYQLLVIPWALLRMFYCFLTEIRTEIMKISTMYGCVCHSVQCDCNTTALSCSGQHSADEADLTVRVVSGAE